MANSAAAAAATMSETQINAVLHELKCLKKWKIEQEIEEVHKDIRNKFLQSSGRSIVLFVVVTILRGVIRDPNFKGLVIFAVLLHLMIALSSHVYIMVCARRKVHSKENELRNVLGSGEMFRGSHSFIWSWLIDLHFVTFVGVIYAFHLFTSV